MLIWTINFHSCITDADTLTFRAEAASLRWTGHEKVDDTGGHENRSSYSNYTEKFIC